MAALLCRFGVNPAAPSELFPDPTLADVADGTNGWNFVDGAPFMGPDGGTGPGISVDTTFETAGGLANGGTDETEFNSAISGIPTVSVALTFANFIAGSVFVTVGSGSPVEFAPSGNGVVTHNVANGGFGGFVITTNDGIATYDITHTSVTTP